MKRILKYLSRAIKHGLEFKPSTELQINGFVDSNWDSCLNTRHSISSICIYLRANLVIWFANKQPTMSRSSVEIEYRCLDGCTEVVWLQAFLQEIKILISTLHVIWCRSTSAVVMTTNIVLYSKTKHIKLDCHFIDHKVIQKQLKVIQKQLSV